MNKADPEVLFFGCYQVPGHCLYSKRNRPRLEEIPWGESIDGGLLVKPGEIHYRSSDTTPTGEYAVDKKGEWLAVSFWDRSGDSRPRSNSAFLVRDYMTPEELIDLARQQWPEIFARPGFPNNLRPKA